MAIQHQTQGQESSRQRGTQGNGQISAADVDRALCGMDYPLSKSDILAYAQSHGCRTQVLRALEGLPERVYETLTEVEADLGLAL
jgi:hypothetical protein